MATLEDILKREVRNIYVSKRFSPQKFQENLEQGFRQYGYRESGGTIVEILVLALNAIGDNVLYSAFLRELRRNYPQSHITVVVTPLVYPLVEYCPYVNSVLTFPLHPYENFNEYFPRMIEFAQKELWPRRFALSISPMWSDDKRPLNLLSFLSGARRRLGISDEALRAYGINCSLADQWEFLLTDAIITPTDVTHEAARALYIISYLDGLVADKTTELWLTAADTNRVNELFNTENAYVVLGLGAGASNRKYPLDKWGVALREIMMRYSLCVVICGGKAEEQEGKYIAALLPQDRVINLTNRTSLRETAAVIKMARCYLGNVTGMMHMAAAVHTPLICLYREAVKRPEAPAGIFSESTRFAPWQAQAVILQPEEAIGKCAHMVTYGGCLSEAAHCIAQISPQEVVQAFAYVWEHFVQTE